MRKRRWLAVFLPWLPVLILALALRARPARAANFVVQAPCGETEFDLALGNVLDSGGGIRTFSTGPTELRNVTLGENRANTGGALQILAGPQGLTLTNTLIGNTVAGGNCIGVPAAANYSVSDDVTCTPNGTDNQSHVPLQLTALGNYGGPTPVYMPKITSPAIDGVGGNDAPSSDQRAFHRTEGDGYDIGTVERQPNDSDLAPRLYLPLTRR